MKNIFYALAILSTLIYSGSSFAEPIAQLAPLNAFGKQSFAAEGKTEAQVRQDIPSKEMVGLPAYPGSYFAGAMGDEDAISTVTLMSKASPEEVVAWYSKTLGGEWQNMPEFASEQLGEVAVFIKSSKKKISVMDTFKLQQIRISRVEKPEDTGFAAMIFDVSGIKSMINMTIKPLM